MWHTILTFIKAPCKFEQNRPRNVGVDVNGLKLLCRIYEFGYRKL